VWPRRTAYYRLMTLARTGRVHTRATGSLIYLLRLAGQATQLKGRLWIELNCEPAVTVRYVYTQRVVPPQ
jgi:hypothetical protein